MRSRLCFLLAAALVLCAAGIVSPARAQQGGFGNGAGASAAGVQPPQTLTIAGLDVEGIDRQSMRDYVLRISGLREGQQVTLPGGESLGEAIRAVYRTGLFSDVVVAESGRSDEGVRLTIRVTPEPGLASYSFRGIKGSHEDDLRERITLSDGRPVRPGDIERAEQAIRAFYSDEGYLLADVNTLRERQDDGQVRLLFNVDRGEKIEVEDIRFIGNNAFDDGDLRGAMQDTREDRWWRFWKSEKFPGEEKYRADLDRVVDYYNERGYYDARIVSDTTYVRGREDLVAEVTVREGSKYHIRNVRWRGNTVYPDEVLTRALGFQKGDAYDSRQLQENLQANRASTDVTSLYTDRGYVLFDVQPSVQPAPGDSLDLVFDIREGDVFEVGNVEIAGNTKTKEHVIRRELYTVPGRVFSRSDIRESMRRLQQLGYFSQESLAAPSINIDQQNKEVDLTYTLEEVSNDQLELSGTYGGFGLVLQTSFTFNNFSAQNIFEPDEWSPLPVGDGQKLSLSVRTAGWDFQNYSLSFTEPWFRGRPTPVGGSISYARISSNYLRRGFRRGRRFGRQETSRDRGVFQQISTQAFRRQRLDWPDDKFVISSTAQYRYYRNDDRLYQTLPGGVSHQLSFEQGITRNSLNNPLFPSSGSKVELSVEVAPPVGELIQFHKWRFTSDWYLPITSDGKLSFNVGTDYGYIGSLTGEEVNFQTFDLGGTAFDYGRQNFGTEPVFMRGYPAQALNPIGVGGQFAGGRILNKYTSQLMYKVLESQQLQAAPYLFLDAANTWAGFDTYDPSSLYRAAGVGAQLYLPIVGMIEVNYGYNFDSFPGRLNTVTEQRLFEEPGWRFQVSFGQGF